MTHVIEPADYFFIGPVLGRGGMGKVVEVTHKVTSKRYAMKYIDAHTGEMQALHEYNAAKAVQSQNVVRYYIHLRLKTPHFDNGVRFNAIIIMELINGQTLSKLVLNYMLTQKERFSMFVLVYTQLVQGMNDLNAAGIYHLDLKPANVMVDLATSRVVIIDMGLACKEHGRRTDTRMCSNRDNSGTPKYFSPEKARMSLRLPTNYEYTQEDAWDVGMILSFILHGRFPITCKGAEVCERVIATETVLGEIFEFDLGTKLMNDTCHAYLRPLLIPPRKNGTALLAGALMLQNDAIQAGIVNPRVFEGFMP